MEAYLFCFELDMHLALCAGLGPLPPVVLSKNRLLVQNPVFRILVCFRVLAAYPLRVFSAHCASVCLRGLSARIVMPGAARFRWRVATLR